MWQRNNGQAREELQIKFTGYLIQAVRRTQRDYLKALYAYSNQETLTDTIFVVSQTLEQEVMERLPLWENIESGALLYALKQIDERERYVFLARVLDKRPFDVIGVQLGLSYPPHSLAHGRVQKKSVPELYGQRREQAGQTCSKYPACRFQFLCRFRCGSRRWFQRVLRIRSDRWQRPVHRF